MCFLRLGPHRQAVVADHVGSPGRLAVLVLSTYASSDYVRRLIPGPVAQGLSDDAVAERLALARKTVEVHMARILTKLGLPPGPDQHRRVVAVLRWLGEA